MKLYASTAVAALAALGLVACSAETEASPTAPAATTMPAPVETAEPTAAPAADVDAAAILEEVNAATYEVEKTHAFLFWDVSHGGLSTYTAKFKDWDATIEFDPADVTKSVVTASINPMSVETDHPSKAEEWHDELANDFFKAGEFPAITFQSTSIETTGPMTGEMTGDLTFLGVTKPVTLDVTFNGVGNKPWYGERDLIGFDATGTLMRSEFGLDKHIDNGIGDEVTIRISAEFLEKEPEAPAEEPAE